MPVKRHVELVNGVGVSHHPAAADNGQWRFRVPPARESREKAEMI